jgi:hypothetical protein
MMGKRRTDRMEKKKAENRGRICKPFKKSRNRFPAWRAGTPTLFDALARKLHRLAESISWNRFLGSLGYKNSGSGKDVMGIKRGV